MTMRLQARLSRDQVIGRNFGEAKGEAEKDPKQLPILRKGLSVQGRKKRTEQMREPDRGQESERGLKAGRIKGTKGPVSFITRSSISDSHLHSLYLSRTFSHPPTPLHCRTR